MFALLGFVNVTFAQTVNLTTHQPNSSPPSGATFEWHNALPISASTLVASPTVAIPGLYYGVYNLGNCYSEVAPIRIATNTCPVTTVDLNSFVETTGTPSGMTLAFHSASPVSDANRLTGNAITAATVGTYYVAYRDNIEGCYSTESMIVVINSSCCPTLANVVISNPSTCDGSNGNIKICGLTVNSIDWSVSYDKNGTPVSALTNQNVDANGCITIIGLSSGNYTNIKVIHPINCPSSSNAVSALLTDPVSPMAPVPMANNKSNVCPAITVDLTTLQPLAISGVTYEWHATSNNPTASTLVSTPTAAVAGIYYLYSKSETSSCYSLASSAVTANVILCDDSDHDNIPDITDLDDDNDGILDTIEDAQFSADTDGDGIPNRLDLDSDNDGINDVIEAGGVDANRDGIADGTPGSTGIPSSAGTGLVVPDTDGDARPNPYDLDSDNDGINDLVESGNPALVDTDGNGIVDGLDPDGDGILGAADGLSGSRGDSGDPVPVDTDGDGIPNFRDLDSDGDGISDLKESGILNPETLDANNDGKIDSIVDPDGDGIISLVDGIPNIFGDSNNPTLPDTDGDGNTDYTDASPIANADNITIISGVSINIPVLSNDKNGDGTLADLAKITLPTVSTSGVGTPTKGTVTVNPDGTISYTPNLGTSGGDTFIYTICDKANPTICDTAKVTINIICPKPVLTVQNITCSGTGSGYTATFSSNATVTTNNGTISGNTVTVSSGNATLTSTTSCGEVTSLVVTAPSCPVPATCTQVPSLSVGNALCTGTGTYTLSFSASNGTVTSSAGTVSGNAVINIPVGTNAVLTITPTSTACSGQSITVTSPVSCAAPSCSDGSLGISFSTVCNNNGTYNINYTTSIAGTTVTSSANSFANLTGTVTLTVTKPGCSPQSVVVSAPVCVLCSKPVLTVQNITCSGTGSGYTVTFSSNATVTTNNGTVSGNTVTVSSGNATLTSTTSCGEVTSLVVTAPSCPVPATCTLVPSLSVGNALCTGTGTYTVSFSATNGTVTSSAGTVSGNTVINIPVGTNAVLTITPSSTACNSQSITVTSPVSCAAPSCSDGSVGISFSTSCNIGGTYNINYTTSIAGTTVTSS
eukprot:gene11720-24580_t